MADPKPRASIRRFDVFAEYNRIKAMEDEKLSAAKAKGYGLWLAKVVAARKFRRESKSDGEGKQRKSVSDLLDSRGWHKLSGVSQTDKLFDKEIVARMGTTFYRRVFAPAIRKAYKAGKSYEEIRDRIRADWKAQS